MPQDVLTNASKIIEADAALISARRHVRGGKRYILRGESTAGMTALYIAVLCGMRYYIAKNKRCASFLENSDLWDATGLFYALTRAGVFDDPLAFNRFSLMVERALWQGSFSFDADATLAEVETILKKLGVMPFDESALPSETLVLHRSLNKGFV
jgi:hypothetical protein